MGHHRTRADEDSEVSGWKKVPKELKKQLKERVRETSETTWWV